MHRIELYLDKNDNLVADLYYELNDVNPSCRAVEKNCYELISEICTQPIKNIRKKKNQNKLVLIYDECFLSINEYKKVFSIKREIPLIKSINQYCNSKKNQTRKKVIRKNKYAGKRLIASALVLTTLGSAAFFFGKKSSHKLESIDSTSVIYLDEDLHDTDPSIDMVVGEDGFVPELAPNADLVSEPSSNPDDIIIDTIQEPDVEEIDNSIQISISYEDRSDTDKARKTEAWYGETIEIYAKKYGLDPKLVIAIATQERGVHSEKMDLGGATGLMQIQNEVWAAQELTAYNYETESYETIVVNEDRLSDVYYNIKVGCMVFQNCMDYMDNNVLAAIQCYNMGYGNMRKILKAYSAETGKSVDQILSDISDCGWLEYRDIIKVGDQEYLENVLSWIGSKFNINNLNLNGTIVNLNINNQSEIKNVSIN